MCAAHARGCRPGVFSTQKPAVVRKFSPRLLQLCSRERFEETPMKLRHSLLAMLLGTAVIGSSSALARDRDYDDRCANCGTVVDVEQVNRRDNHVGAGTAVGAIAGGVL